MKKTKAIHTNPAWRRRIKKLFNEGNTIRELMELTGGTYFQVYNAINGKVKLYKSPRIDKGKPRKKNKTQEVPLAKNLDQYNSVDEFLEHQLMSALEDLSCEQMTSDERLKRVKDAATLNAKIKQAKLDEYIRRPEAILIMRIMKRLAPKLTDEQMKIVYQEELEKLRRDLKENQN